MTPLIETTTSPANPPLHPWGWEIVIYLFLRMLIIAAEMQRLLQARNQALPQLNAVAQYQWNGLSGTMPNGATLSTRRWRSQARSFASGQVKVTLRSMRTRRRWSPSC